MFAKSYTCKNGDCTNDSHPGLKWCRKCIEEEFAKQKTERAADTQEPEATAYLVFEGKKYAPLSGESMDVFRRRMKRVEGCSDQYKRRCEECLDYLASHEVKEDMGNLACTDGTCEECSDA